MSDGRAGNLEQRSHRSPRPSVPAPGREDTTCWLPERPRPKTPSSLFDIDLRSNLVWWHRGQHRPAFPIELLYDIAQDRKLTKQADEYWVYANFIEPRGESRASSGLARNSTSASVASADIRQDFHRCGAHKFCLAQSPISAAQHGTHHGNDGRGLPGPPVDRLRRLRRCAAFFRPPS